MRWIAPAYAPLASSPNGPSRICWLCRSSGRQGWLPYAQRSADVRRLKKERVEKPVRHINIIKVGMGLLAVILLVNIARGADMPVKNAWIRALPMGLPSAGYFTLFNDTRKDMILTGATSSACRQLTLHKSETTGGLCRMIDLPEVDVPALSSVSFMPGSYHLMCMGLDPQKKPGTIIDMILLFKDGTRLPARFAVRNAAGK